MSDNALHYLTRQDLVLLDRIIINNVCDIFDSDLGYYHKNFKIIYFANYVIIYVVYKY